MKEGKGGIKSNLKWSEYGVERVEGGKEGKMLM
jgi:hypothetical protein